MDEFDITQEAKTVIVVAMSARSGSSWLIEQLKHSADLVHFRGELTTFLRLHGLTPATTSILSEALDAGDVSRATEAFRRDLTAEVGYPLAFIDDEERFTADIIRRLSLQWPDIDFHGASEFVGRFVAAEISKQRGFDAVAFSRELLSALEAIFPIDANFYDFGLEPDAKCDERYPFNRALESPPFLLFSPWRRAGKRDVQTKPVVLKSAGDVYRLDFYRALFPNARIRVLHLRRNPAASINGLMNAWMSRKYQSFRVGNLAIAGYSEVAEWRRQWWKLDLAPGWQGYRDQPLASVCEWQWRNAQDTVLDWCAHNRETPFVARYEDMTASAESRHGLMSQICDWLEVPRFVPPTTRFVNASTAPRKQGWIERADEIIPLIESPACRRTTARLAYHPDYEAWI